jgi:hypothetical protein
MLLNKIQRRQRVRLFLLMAEINALKKCMIESYEQSENLLDPILVQLSEILDLRLNELCQFTKNQHIRT